MDAYIITADQAHAWPEIYFPEYGWIQFEPTGGRPAIERPPEALPELPEDFELDFSPLVPERRFSLNNGTLIFWIVLFFVVLLILSIWLITDWWLGRMPASKGLPKLYRRLFRYGRWMKLNTEPGITPFEFSNYLIVHLRQLAAGSHWTDWLLEAENPLRQITANYVRIKFNPSSEDTMVFHEIMTSYKQLRLRIWVLWFMGRIYKFWFLRPLFWSEPPLFISSFVEEEQ
jgi:hypothetical protein